MHVGFFDFTIAEMGRRIALDDGVADGLADDLRIDNRVLRHVDDQIAFNGRRTREAAVWRYFANFGIA